jgi:CubicO group peptidase (beta-lactamase class C family)
MRLNLVWPTDLPFDSPDNPDTGIELSDDWAQYVLDFPMAAPPGTSFQYNSGATQLIGAMLREATGVELAEYARRHLFRKLGIDRFYWKQTPSGASDALGGLYLTAEDLARIGQLMLDDGQWNGASVVSADWVRKSLAPITQDAGDGYAYGYQWWLPGDEFGAGAFEGSGYGGQLLLGLPEHDMVVVLYAWNPYFSYPEPKQSARAMLVRRLKSDIIPRLAK